MLLWVVIASVLTNEFSWLQTRNVWLGRVIDIPHLDHAGGVLIALLLGYLVSLVLGLIGVIDHAVVCWLVIDHLLIGEGMNI